MRVVMFYHSLISDWNHGNAHFLRGVAGELQARGHTVEIYEPKSSWSLANLLAEHGEAPLREFQQIYPNLTSFRYEPETLDLDQALDGADLVLVHEWNTHELVRRVGAHRRLNTGYRLLFHDTHHRAASDPASMAAYDLTHYDGVLAFGEVLRRIYLDNGWIERAWTWHEAADIRIFFPQPQAKQGDLVWIGNWGDEERSAELNEFLLRPCRELRLKARVYGVRYPQHARDALARAHVMYAGWLPNYRAPQIFGRHRVTVHIPRRPYAWSLPGIPTIRPFEALACAIPLVCAPWDDAEHLFTPGEDYLVARDGQQMKEHLSLLLHEPEVAGKLANHGLKTILASHTCAHRVEELLRIAEELDVNTDAGAMPHKKKQVSPARPGGWEPFTNAPNLRGAP